MRTDLPLHSKSPNRARHLKEIEVRRIQIEQMSGAILKVIKLNLSRREMMKLYFLLKEWRNIIFDTTKRKPRMSIDWPETDLPPELREILRIEYPVTDKRLEDGEL